MVGKLIVENFLIIKERNKDYGELWIRLLILFLVY